MNKSSLINPYSLLGVNVDSNLSELKKIIIICLYYAIQTKVEMIMICL